VACQFRQPARRAVLLQIRRRRAQDAVVGHQLARDQMRCDIVADADVQVKAFGHDIDQPVEHFKAHLQRRMRRNQARHHRRHHIAAEAKAAADAQQAARHVAPFGDFVQQAVEVFQDGHGVRVDALAVLADDDTARGAVEQAHAQHLLQYADTLADVGRRHAQFLGGRRKAGLAGSCGKDAQVLVVDTIIHDMFIESQCGAL
jgi:hypothetical protein